MPVQLTKDAVDIGVVVKDIDASLAFYRDLLGMASMGEIPIRRGGRMHLLQCGSSIIKLVVHPGQTLAESPPDGLYGGYGYRYFTLFVSNLDEVVAACSASYKIAMPRTEVAPGAALAILEDPDGNWVELVERSKA